MELIHYWPLQGNTEDFGTWATTQSCTGSFEESIFGNCYLSDDNTDHIRINDLEKLHTLKKYTISCWARSKRTASAHSSSFLSSGNWNTSGQTICFGLYDANSEGYRQLLYPSLSGWTTSFSLPKRIRFNEWHNYIITFDGTTTKAYVDGELVGSSKKGGIAMTEAKTYYYLGAATYYNGFTLKGNLSDFRIYDDVITGLEFDTITQRPIVHYNFEEVEKHYSESFIKVDEITGHGSTWELLKNTNCLLPIYRNHVTEEDWNNAGFKYNGKSCPIQKVKQMQISFDVKVLSSYGRNLGGYITLLYTDGTTEQKGWSYNKYNWSTDPNTLNQWQHVVGTATFTANKIVNQIKLLYVYADKATLNAEALYTNIQLKAMDSYYINDSSSGRHDGFLKGEHTLSTTTIYGEHSLQVKQIGTEAKPSNANVGAVVADLGELFSPAAFSIIMRAKINKIGYQGSGFVSLSTSASSPSDYSGSTLNHYDSSFQINMQDGSKMRVGGVSSASDWHTYVLTADNNEAILYRDGNEIRKVTVTTNSPIRTMRYVWLNYSNAGGASRDSDITWADFKLILKKLTPEEVRKNYNVAKRISKNGSILIDFLNENTTFDHSSINKKCVQKTKEIIERKEVANTRENIVTLEDGSRWLHIMHHDNKGGTNLFSSRDHFNEFVFHNDDCWSDFSKLDITFNEAYHYMVIEERTPGDKIRRRWYQDVNPLTASWATVEKNSGNYHEVENMEPNDGGIYRRNILTYIVGANECEECWYGAMGCWTKYSVGIPTFGRTSTAGVIDLYVRLGYRACKEYKNGKIECHNIIEL